MQILYVEWILNILVCFRSFFSYDRRNRALLVRWGEFFPKLLGVPINEFLRETQTIIKELRLDNFHLKTCNFESCSCEMSYLCSAGDFATWVCTRVHVFVLNLYRHLPGKNKRRLNNGNVPYKERDCVSNIHVWISCKRQHNIDRNRHDDNLATF